MGLSSPRLTAVLLLFLLTIPKLSKPCIHILNHGWKPLSAGERAKLVKVVFIGKVVNLYTYDEVSQTHAADFEVRRILKGRKIVDEVLEMHPSPLVKVYGFGEKRLCRSPVNPGEVHMVFMVYEPNSRSLVARYDDIFGATAPATANNEADVLQALGWKPWSSWSRCSKNCGEGDQTRTRTCSAKDCDGATKEARTCNKYECYGVKDIARLLRLEQNPPASKNDNIKVESGRAASIPVSKVFRYYNYFPDDFSILITFRAMSLTDVYLMAMYDYRKHLSLGVRIKPDLVSFDFEKISPFLQSEWSVDFAVKVRKAQWHTLGISIQERNVTVFWDCKKTGSKDLHETFSLIPDPLGELYVGKPRIVSSIERYEIEVSELYFVPDAGASRGQCEAPLFKPLLDEQETEGSGGGGPDIYHKEGSGTPNYVDDPENEVEISWSEWSQCSQTCGKGHRKRVMMCDLENSYSDENGLPSEECLRALQNVDVKECYLQDCPAKCDRPCLNGGFCISRNHCQCQPGYRGDVCERVECKIHCRNGGTCVGPYKCSCPPGYGGSQCEKALCSPPCQYGGQCKKPNVCHCSRGFLAPYCRPSCSPPCLNGGVCVGPNKCRCAKGFTGEYCQQAVCNQPCMNGGVCYQPDKCSCLYGWHGNSCEKARCFPTCRNGGTCIRRNTCACSRGYFGYYCQHGGGKKIVNTEARRRILAQKRNH